MSVKLIWITPEAERLIAYIARVSNPSNQENPEYERLIRYLIKNRHWSPFEMASMCLEIKTSRAISTQILRHRSFSFQEFSQRYAEVVDFEPIEIRKQSESNRQSSTDTFDPKSEDISASELINYTIKNSENTYKKLIELGVAKEIARLILPLSSSTTIYMSGTIRSWIHYIDLRTDEHTQKEHRLIAEQAKQLFKLYLPTISDALDWK